MTPPRFWPFYDDDDVTIYDNPAWDMPGRGKSKKTRERRCLKGGGRQDCLPHL